MTSDSLKPGLMNTGLSYIFIYSKYIIIMLTFEQGQI